ncbi:hypothetical protein U1Q18_030508 [Sarracenia purpurea var. burkii]
MKSDKPIEQGFQLGFQQQIAIMLCEIKKNGIRHTTSKLKQTTSEVGEAIRNPSERVWSAMMSAGVASNDAGKGGQRCSAIV